MAEDWRDHLTDEGDGTMRIKAHGNMKVDARLFTNAWYMFYQSYVITGVGMTAIAGNILKLFIAPISGVLITLFILNQIDLSGWYKFIINTSAICFIFISLVYFLSLNRSERYEIKKFIKDFSKI